MDPAASPRARAALRVVFALFLAFVYLPTAIAVLVSFGRDPLGLSLGGPTLRWYRRVLADEGLRHALAAGLEVALAVAAIDVALAVLLGFALARRHPPGPPAFRRALLAATLVPFVLPPATYGVAFLVLARRGPVPVPFGLRLVVAAHAVLFLPVAVLLVVPAIGAIGRDLVESAEDLGADGLALLRRLVLPLVARPLALAFLLVAVLSLNEPAAAPLLIDRQPTFAAWLWFYARYAPNAPFTSALGTLAWGLAVLVALAGRGLLVLRRG